MRILCISAFVLFILSSCNQKPANSSTFNSNDSTFTVSGNIIGLDTGSLIFVHRIGDKKIYDTVEVKKGDFNFAGKIPAGEGANLYTCFVDGKNDVQLDLLVENARIQLSGKADSIDNAEVTGSVSQTDLNAFSKQIADVKAVTDQLDKAYSATESNTVKDSIGKEYDKYDSILQSRVPDFVKGHNHSYASAFVVNRTLLINPKVEVLEPVYNSLDSLVKQSKYGKIIAEVLEALKKSAIGQIAPDFTMNDRDGKPVTLSSFRGKVIFLDFWASWCGPCRHENPNIVAAYAKFHSPKFDILGVSLDRKKDAWEEAIAKDKLTWNHVSDLQGWSNAAGKIYGIRSIPANLLLDKDGKVLARNLYGSALEKKLAEVLK